MGISKDAKLIGRFRLSGPIVIGPQDNPELSLIPTLGEGADYFYSVFQETEGDTRTVTLVFPTGEITVAVVAGPQG